MRQPQVKADGLFLGHLDLNNVKLTTGRDFVKDAAGLWRSLPPEKKRSV